ncbi:MULTISPECIES: carbohydrate ABC transporter permease [unclassified Microbacterium]|uniref:carbohydrate ABC transporter permease n=1 Tax=unclassified Microbacterium TaxID=2609290 RepID=UPI002468C2C4|nr:MULTISPECIES: sugar ABC transporter permease [unclassified Microbacterium]MDH5134763.1 sugar ABC transporter permease [Microbacterium sp. RD10]MDH5137777.1 sugar ABC transporter permease [Microbacterium sp. RD11]MDH5146436.1 sugar ABC transporter permease [Microbacterium sp. RD12]MDH5155913.1 sugar ABC transporter permease [Microbacterium sp. RD06]MDH5167515.1 sugar ABC transporter permease [Microbacterium sp. RD02]
MSHPVASRRRARRASWTGRALLAPAVIAIAIIAIYPLGYIIAASFSESSLGRPFTEWVGFDNFAALLGDGVTLPSLGRSLLFAIPSALIALVAGLVVALSLDAAVKGGRVIRVLLLLPLMTPPVMAGVIWKLMLAPTGGLLNNIGQSFAPGSEPFLFLGSSPAAMISVIMVDAWQWTPFCVLLVFAALQTLPTEVYEASQVDGAGVWQTFWRITFPLVLPSLITVLLLKLVVSFKVFDLVFIMTSGGPGFDTTVSSFQIYRTGLQTFDVGAAAAQTIAFLVLVTIVILPLNAVRQRLHREG